MGNRKDGRVRQWSDLLSVSTFCKRCGAVGDFTKLTLTSDKRRVTSTCWLCNDCLLDFRVWLNFIPTSLHEQLQQLEEML